MSAVLGYEPASGEEDPAGVWVAEQGTYRFAAPCKEELVAVLQQFDVPKGARLMLLGCDVGELSASERDALRNRVGFVPAHGGLLSNLNAWENISLPVGYHSPARLRAVPDEVQALLERVGGIDADMLARLPEQLTLYEKRLTAYVRALLERPELLVVENLAAGLGPTKRRRTARFAEIYHAHCPGGTYVQLDDA